MIERMSEALHRADGPGAAAGAESATLTYDPVLRWFYPAENFPDAPCLFCGQRVDATLEIWREHSDGGRTFAGYCCQRCYGDAVWELASDEASAT